MRLLEKVERIACTMEQQTVILMRLENLQAGMAADAAANHKLFAEDLQQRASERRASEAISLIRQVLR